MPSSQTGHTSPGTKKAISGLAASVVSKRATTNVASMLPPGRPPAEVFHVLAPQDVHQRDRPDNADQMIRLVDHRHGSHLVVQRDRCRLLLVRVGCDPGCSGSITSPKTVSSARASNSARRATTSFGSTWSAEVSLLGAVSGAVAAFTYSPRALRASSKHGGRTNRIPGRCQDDFRVNAVSVPRQPSVRWNTQADKQSALAGCLAHLIGPSTLKREMPEIGAATPCVAVETALRVQATNDRKSYD